MTGITGVPDMLMRFEAVEVPRGADPAAAAHVFESGSTESRVLDAVVACAARWGIDKTTVDDVAREAGVSRATVYRLFPSGKSAMVHLSTNREVISMLMGLLQRVERCATLTDAVVELLHGGTTRLASQPAVAYMSAHEPGKLRAFFSLDRLDSLFALTADVVAPSLYRFLDASAARECVIWAARLVLSYYLNPDPQRNLAEVDFARRLAETHVMAGIGSNPVHPPTIQETQT
jgi:AcrR family transcriptional regulator